MDSGKVKEVITVQKKLCILLVLSACFFMSSSACSNELGTYLEDLLGKNNQIKSYEAKKEQAEEKLWQAKSKYMPRVDASAQAGKETIAREVGEYSSKDRSYVNVKSTQLVTDFGKTSAGIARARGLMRQAELQLNLVRKQVLLEGITAYLQVLQAREQLHYAKKSEKNIREQTGMEETLVRKGAGLSSDVLQAKAQLSGAMALRVRAEGDLETALSRFQAVFHTVLDEGEIATLTTPAIREDNIPLTKDEAVSQALKANPRLLVLRKALDVAGRDIDIQQGNLLPTVNLFAELEYKENDAGIRGYRKDTRGGVEVNYNLFSSGGDWASFKAARKNRVSVLKNLEYEQKQVEKRARNDWNNFLVQTKNHRLLQNQARIANEFLELAKKERKLGNRSLLDILAGETEYIRSVSDAVAAEISRKLAVYKLLYTTGDLSLNTVTR